MTKGVSIRRLAPGDEPLLQALCRLMRNERTTPETCWRILADPGNYLLAATLSDEAAGHDELAGWVIGHRIARFLRDEMFLFELDVLAPFQRRGVGRALVGALADAARADGLAEMFVFTNASNDAAMALYASTGAYRANPDDVLWNWHLLTSKSGGL
jgi:ribosomal protein S18 acetylase RimI-like enzyme